MAIHFSPRTTSGSEVKRLDAQSWRLSIPPGPKGKYRWSQLDDYLDRPRKEFLWKPPFHLSLNARVSNQNINGTWGFGFWNDPFNVSFGIGGTSRRIPALPNTAWYFFASPPNYLSLSDDSPADGFMAASFSSKKIPDWLLISGIPLLPLLFIPFTGKLLRPLFRSYIKDDNKLLDLNTTQWHKYEILCGYNKVEFVVDDNIVHTSTVVPKGCMGCVLWIDNQYAAYPPNGKVSFGTLKTEKNEWLNVSEISIIPEIKRHKS